MLSRRLFIRSAAAFASLSACLAAPSALAQDYTGSIASVTPQTATSGKLATRTEIVADRGQVAMLTPGSLEALQGAIAQYEEIVAGGGWPMVEGKKLARGARGPNIIILRQRLVSEGYLPFDTLSGDKPNVYDDGMAEAVKAFQANHGVAVSGRVDDRTLAELNITAGARLFTLRENLARVEAYAKGLGARNILVNIPSAQLETVENGRVYSRHNVVAGKLDRPSPALASTVSDITFNPYWKAPASIVEKDLIPQYLKDRNYLEQLGIRVFDGVGGPEIDPATVDWANTAPDRYFFRQDPGDKNALAKVKINFPNKFMVYMHDTPHRELFDRNARYESSGCIRIDQVRIVVNWILRGQEDYNESEYDSITASNEPYELKVQNPPEVRFMYLTAWATEDGAVNFRPDIYGLDGTGFVFGEPEPRSF
ncbi:MAG: L,D-transpeptidase family protein [Rhizobiales bacterium]|nr:L,D-transpeptidase family protein [Hyphomicrobiales bacterium]MBI3671920.1 L,D-transpeptidase family protein [Hyphomicrobiales bacterium]